MLKRCILPCLLVATVADLGARRAPVRQPIFSSLAGVDTIHRGLMLGFCAYAETLHSSMLTGRNGCRSRRPTRPGKAAYFQQFGGCGHNSPRLNARILRLC